MEFPWQEYWSVLPFPSPGDFPDPGIEHASPAFAGGFFTAQLPGKTTFAKLPYILDSCYKLGSTNLGHSWEIWKREANKDCLLIALMLASMFRECLQWLDSNSQRGVIRFTAVRWQLRQQLWLRWPQEQLPDSVSQLVVGERPGLVSCIFLKCP